MQNSSPSTAHCTQVPIKVQHKIAKRRPIRRRRVDLTCGCSYHDIITIQIQFNHNLRKALGIHQCFLSFQIWTLLQPQTWRFLRVFRVQCMKYLDNLGVISINNVIRACNHVLWDVLEKTEYVTHSNIIKFNLY
nr:AC2 protein [Ageratum yellow vein China virus]